jgi:hypothetical protein
VRRTVAIAVVLVAAGCGGRGPPPQTPPEVRAVAQAYLDALVRGESEAACRLLSPAAMKDSGYGSIAECARDRCVEPGRVDRIPILEIRMLSREEAQVTVGDAEFSDGGNDYLPVKRYGDRWLVED